jgi:hypothetical protein
MAFGTSVILGGKRVVKIVCGATTSYALSKNRSVWMWPNEVPQKVQQLQIPGGRYPIQVPSILCVCVCLCGV